MIVGEGMQEVQFLRDLAVVFGCAAPLVYLFHRFKQSPIVGFVITGTLVGPYGFSLIRDVENVHTLATVGVMILLFSLGLEFSLKKLMETRVAVLVIGPLQMLGTIAVTVLLVHWFGTPLQTGVIYGVLIGLSSTAIFMKMLDERRETDSIHGRIGLGVAIFQDLCTIPFLISISLMATEKTLLTALGSALLKSVALIAAVVLVGRYLFPILLRGILRTRSKELFLITSVFIFLGTALATTYAGVSLALGSFLAGLILSESEYGHHIFAEVRPFRDSLNSLFFISIGMLIDPGFIATHPGPIVAITAAIVAGKTLLTTGAVMATRIPLHVALLTGVALAQVGEFSFIMLQTAASVGAVSAEPYQFFLSCSVLSMVLAPVLFGISRKLLNRFVRNWNPQMQFGRLGDEKLREFEKLRDHVIICGFGLGGQNMARVLKANRIPYMVIDLNEQRVSEARKEGELIIFGDCTSTHILEMAGIHKARVVVFVISDPFASRLAVGAAREMSREIVVLTRTKYVADIDALWDQGSNEVISEEFEASLELMTRILRVYNAPRSMVAAEIKSIRDQRFGIFRERQTTVPRIRLSGDLDVYTETWEVAANCPWRGATIAETGLREKTGALILGIIRENHTLNNPPANEFIMAGDRLVLSGTKEQLKSAILMLSQIMGVQKQPA
jgi:CPA2 family monovalent cation:H+ antiporter-2